LATGCLLKPLEEPKKCIFNFLSRFEIGKPCYFFIAPKGAVLNLQGCKKTISQVMKDILIVLLYQGT
jgi:hypothetical protein